MKRPDSLGTRMRQVRREADLTQKEIADMLGIKRNTYTHYEINASSPPVDTLRDFAKIMDVSTDYLLGLTDTK